jgi:hypothetical protein
MWLSMFVLRATPFDVVNMDDFTISATMVHGQGMTLALPALAAEMKTYVFFSKNTADLCLIILRRMV